MNPLLLYMIKVAFYLAALYLVFSFLLSRDTLYKRNRYFIILSIASAIILPFITIVTDNPVNLPIFGKTLSEVLISGSSRGSEAAGMWGIKFTLPQIMFFIYLSGILIFGSRLVTDLAELAVLISREKTTGSNIIRYHGFNTAGFSALGYIFISSKLSDEDAGEIIKHEQNHLDHHHFFDILFIEFVKVFQWFNPFIHMFNRSLRAVHEFQADEGCLNKGIPMVSYQQLLMNQLFRSKAFSITNSFSNPTLIKKRMIMMTKKRSKTMANLKLLMVLPVIAIVMIAFSSCGDKPKSAVSVTEEIAPPPPPPPPQGYSDKKVEAGSPVPADAPPPPPPFTVKNGDTTWYQVDEMPVFKGGDAEILKFIAKNTQYPDAAKKNGIQGRVIVSFVITENGKISNALINKGVSPEIDAEALRVVNSMPAFEKPGMMNGKPVPVWFMVPITFQLK